MRLKQHYFSLLILLFLPRLLFSQSTTTNNTRPATPAFNGWDGGGTNPGALDIRNDFSGCTICNIDFYIDNNKFVQVLTSGDVNVVVGTNGYMIDNDFVLRHNNIKSNIYVGVGAGNTNATAYNTFVGDSTGTNTGNSIVFPGEGTRNTFVGHLAGFSNDRGQENSFFGDSAGYNTLGGIDNGYHNTFIGASTGWSNISGKSNTLVGFECGYKNDSSNYNTMVGRAAGKNAVGTANSYFGKDAADILKGNGNCCYGAHASANIPDTIECNSLSTFGTDAGRGIRGSENCFFGFNSGRSAPGADWVGNYNCFVGSNSGGGYGVDTIMNESGGLGHFAMTNSSYKIIIGGSPFVPNQIHVGIGLSDDQSIYKGPRSPLEINSDSTSTEVGTGVGITGSGLQFRQLTAASPNNANTYIAPFGRVLTVDSSGIVKLTDGGNSFGYGICPNPTILPDHIGMEFNDFSIYYDGQAYSAKDNVMRNAIGIGYPCSVDLPGKLSVDQTYIATSVDFATTAGYFHNGDISTNSPSLSFTKRSIYSICDGYSNTNEEQGITNVAGDFVATNAEYLNIAVRGRTGIHSPVVTRGQYGFGGYFEAIKSSLQDIGVCAISDGNGTNSNYGIYASAPIGVCNNGGPCSDAAGYFNGDVYTTSPAYFSSSDINLKDNIQPIQNSTAIVSALNPKTFSYRRSQFPYLNLADGVQGGLIAQEVQNVLPQLVKSFSVPARIDSTGMLDTLGSNTPFLAVNYIGIIPYLIGAVKEQQQKIDSLNNTIDSLNENQQQLSDRLDALQDQINSCCSTSSSRNASPTNISNSIDVTLSSENTIILNQNDPNPFAENTRITFTIPQNITDAKIIFFDNSGKVLQTVTINERGAGSINVYSGNLSSGIYSYSLIADNKVIDTKKMVCSK